MNMSGFFNGKDTEFVIVKELEDDIKFDFNVNPRDLSFTTSSARFLQKIYAEYLIYGTLALTKGDYKVRVPEMYRLLGNNENVQDDIILRRFEVNCVRLIHWMFPCEKTVTFEMKMISSATPVPSPISLLSFTRI
jgi:hypothetical protein